MFYYSSRDTQDISQYINALNASLYPESPFLYLDILHLFICRTLKLMQTMLDFGFEPMHTRNSEPTTERMIVIMFLFSSPEFNLFEWCFNSDFRMKYSHFLLQLPHSPFNCDQLQITRHVRWNYSHFAELNPRHAHNIGKHFQHQTSLARLQIHQLSSAANPSIWHCHKIWKWKLTQTGKWCQFWKAEPRTGQVWYKLGTTYRSLRKTKRRNLFPFEIGRASCRERV